VWRNRRRDGLSLHSDPILRDIQRVARTLRLLGGFEKAFPFLVAVGMGMVFLQAAPSGLGWATRITVWPIAFTCLWVFLAWRARPLREADAAVAIDAALRLPDSLVAYVEYSLLPCPNRFHRAHLDQVRRRLPCGVDWRPRDIHPLRFLCVALLLVVPCLPAGPWLSLPEPRGSKAAVSAAQQKVSEAAQRLKRPDADPLSVTMERIASLAVPSTPIDRERFLKRLDAVSWELTSAEDKLAGEFLADLLKRSVVPGGEWDLLSQALRGGRVEDAARMARRIASRSGPSGLTPGLEAEVLQALRDGAVQARNAGTDAAGPLPASDEIRHRLKAFADQLVSENQAQTRDALRSARLALQDLERAVKDLALSGSPGPDVASGNTPPMFRPSQTGRRHDPSTSPVSVTPFVAEGRGELTATVLDTQDSGMAAVPSEETALPTGQWKPAPVATTPVSWSDLETVRRYFDHVYEALTHATPRE
jgi:hypothetical protein